MSLALLAMLPILLTEYGFQSRAGMVEGFRASWRLRRTLVRLAFWIILLLFVGLRPVGFLVVGLGIVLNELGAVVLRRRLRIDMGHEKPNGLPHTHLIHAFDPIRHWDPCSGDVAPGSAAARWEFAGRTSSNWGDVASDPL